MLSRAVRAVPRAAPLRSVRAVAPFAARSVTTDAASSSLSNKVPEVRVNWIHRALRVELGWNGEIWCCRSTLNCVY